MLLPKLILLSHKHCLQCWLLSIVNLHFLIHFYRDFSILFIMQAHRNFTLFFLCSSLSESFIRKCWEHHTYMHKQFTNAHTTCLFTVHNLRTNAKYCINICSNKTIWLWFLPKLCNILWNLKYAYGLVWSDGFVMIHNLTIINKKDHKCNTYYN